MHYIDLSLAWPWPWLCIVLTLTSVCMTLALHYLDLACSISDLPQKKFTTILCLFQKRSRSRRRRWWWSRLSPPPRQWGHLVVSRPAAVCATYWQQRQSWSHRNATRATWRVVYLCSEADLGGEGRAPPPQTNFLKFSCSFRPKLCQIIRWRPGVGTTHPSPRWKPWNRHWFCICGSDCVVTKGENCHWWTIPDVVLTLLQLEDTRLITLNTEHELGAKVGSCALHWHLLQTQILSVNTVTCCHGTHFLRHAHA